MKSHKALKLFLACVAFITIREIAVHYFEATFPVERYLIIQIGFRLISVPVLIFFLIKSVKYYRELRNFNFPIGATLILSGLLLFSSTTTLIGLTYTLLTIPN